jgi:hypothetical protein
VIGGGARSARVPNRNQINADRNQPVNGSNFRDDINLSGVVDRPDLLAVRANRGHRLP